MRLAEPKSPSSTTLIVPELGINVSLVRYELFPRQGALKV